MLLGDAFRSNRLVGLALAITCTLAGALMGCSGADASDRSSDRGERAAASALRGDGVRTIWSHDDRQQRFAVPRGDTAYISSWSHTGESDVTFGIHPVDLRASESSSLAPALAGSVPMDRDDAVVRVEASDNGRWMAWLVVAGAAPYPTQLEVLDIARGSVTKLSESEFGGWIGNFEFAHDALYVEGFDGVYRSRLATEAGSASSPVLVVVGDPGAHGLLVVGDRVWMAVRYVANYVTTSTILTATIPIRDDDPPSELEIADRAERPVSNLARTDGGVVYAFGPPTEAGGPTGETLIKRSDTSSPTEPKVVATLSRSLPMASWPLPTIVAASGEVFISQRHEILAVSESDGRVRNVTQLQADAGEVAVVHELFAPGDRLFAVVATRRNKLTPDRVHLVEIESTR